MSHINCPTLNCHIICDELSGCHGVIVNASKSDTLIMECNNDSSCVSFEITGPTTDLYINCQALQACRQGIINAPHTTNVNLLCDFSSSLPINSACSQFKLDASQSPSVLINCLGQYSCYNADFFVDNAGTVKINSDGLYAMRFNDVYAYDVANELNITCMGTRSCEAANIYADYMTNQLIINCHYLYSCVSMNIYATNMQSSLIIGCNAESSCQQIDLYCSAHAACNMNCNPFPNSCRYTQIYIPGKTYKHLNLLCDPLDSTSCEETDIRCTDTGLITTYEWDTTNLYFKCNSYQCCPATVFEGIFTCSSGICQTNCGVENCRNHLINGTLADSLIVDCSGSGCDGSKIICPVGNFSSCNIMCSGSTCSYTIIEITGDTLGDFNLDCGTSSACEYVSVVMESTSIVNVSITCTEQFSCRYSSFSIHSHITNEFYLLCQADSSCYQSSINIEGKYTIKSYQMTCGGALSCQYLSLLLNATSIMDVYIDCGNTDSCRYSTFDIVSIITNKFDLSCSSRRSCYDIDFNVPSTSIN
eukprot:23544_1